MVTSGVYGGFKVIQDQWWDIIAAQIEEKPEAKYEKEHQKTHQLPDPKTH